MLRMRQLRIKPTNMTGTTTHLLVNIFIDAAVVSGFIWFLQCVKNMATTLTAGDIHITKITTWFTSTGLILDVTWRIRQSENWSQQLLGTGNRNNVLFQIKKTLQKCGDSFSILKTCNWLLSRRTSGYAPTSCHTQPFHLSLVTRFLPSFSAAY